MGEALEALSKRCVVIKIVRIARDLEPPISVWRGVVVGGGGDEEGAGALHEQEGIVARVLVHVVERGVARLEEPGSKVFGIGAAVGEQGGEGKALVTSRVEDGLGRDHAFLLCVGKIRQNSDGNVV